MLSWIPENWGKKHQTPNGGVAYSCTESSSIKFRTNAHYFMVFLSALPKRTRSLNSDQILTRPSPAGSLEIFPNNSDLFSSWSTTKETMLIGLPPQRLVILAEHEYENNSFNLHPPTIGIIDRKSLFLCQQIKNEIFHQKFGQDESIEALITLLCIHVLRTYSNLGYKPLKIQRGGLSAKSWNRVREFIQENLSNKLTLEKLADIALLSPSHFLRAFKETTGQTPHQYVLNIRLIEARGLIKKTELTFEEIAKISGFASSSHMSISVKKMWGITPSQLRKLLNH